MRPALPLLLAALVCAADPLYVQDFDRAEAVPEWDAERLVVTAAFAAD